ncbi:MAG: hypothetical protein ACFB0C_13065 [Leptolyngbyaceae cyanobacterium]
MGNVYLDDVEIVRQFIEGEGALVANESLRIQAALDTAQLLARNGQILAIARLQNSPSQVLIRPQSDYAELLHQVLEAYEYVPLGQDAQTQFQRYEHHAVPVGYQLHCAAARELWRQWWLQHRHSPAAFFPEELQLLSNDQWCPIQDIVFNQGTLFVKTALGETIHQGHDSLVWIEQQAEASDDEPTQFLTADMAAEQGYVSTVRQSPQSPQPKRPQTQVPAPLNQIVRHESGKLYVRTALGELVIEGSNLNCRLNRRPHQLAHRSKGCHQLKLESWL